MLTKGSNAEQAQPETGAVAQSQQGSSSTSGRWKWVLYATAGVALVLALKYFHVQDLLKSALDWIGKLGPWGPVIFSASTLWRRYCSSQARCSRLGLAL